jgi:hypothetical protein
LLQPRAAVWGTSKSLLIVPRSLWESEGPSTDRKWRAFPGKDGLLATHGAREDLRPQTEQHTETLRLISAAAVDVKKHETECDIKSRAIPLTGRGGL